MSVISSLLVRIGWDIEDPDTDAPASKIKAGAAKFAAAGAVLGGATALAVTKAMDVEAANDKLAAQLGLSAKESERIGGVAGRLYANAYGENLEQVNDAVGAVMSSIKGMSNASSARIEKVTEKALDFAAAFGVDVERAAQVAGQAVSTGLAKNATEAFDLITAASQRVPANLREDVLDAADEYGQFFKQMGLGGQQAFGVLVANAEKGMYGIDKAGDSIKEFTIRSTDMSEASKDAYKAIGLNAGQMANKILKGGRSSKKAFGQVLDGLLSMKPGAKQANAAIALFGTPLEDLGTKDIPKFLKSLQGGGKAMKGFGGASKEMGDTLNDNAATNIESFKRQATQTFVNVLGGSVLPVVSDVAAKLADDFGPAATAAGEAMQSAAGFIREHSTAAKVLTSVLAGLVVVTAAHSAAMAVSAAGGMSAWIAQTRVVTGLTKVWTAVQWALNSAILANPITWIVVGIVAFVAALVIAYKKSDKFRAIVNKAFGAVKGFVMGVIGWFRKAVPAAIGWVKDKWTAGWTGLKKGTVRVGSAVIDWVKKLPGRIVGFFVKWSLPGIIIRHWDSIKKGTIRVALAIVDWVKGLPGRMVSALRALGSKLLGVARSGFQMLRSGASEKVSALVSWLGGLPGRISSAVGDLGGLLVDKGVSLITGLWEGIKSMGGWLKDQLISWVVDKIPGPIAKVLGINSPSKVMADLARWIPAGMALGIERGTGDVTTAAHRMATAAVPVMPSPRVTTVAASSALGGSPGSLGAGVHVTQNFPTASSPEAAAQAAGGRVVTALEAVGMG